MQNVIKANKFSRDQLVLVHQRLSVSQELVVSVLFRDGEIINANVKYKCRKGDKFTTNTSHYCYHDCCGAVQQVKGWV